MTPLPTRLAAALADRYRIERELGQGGMATVYLATDLKHEREVALKVLRPELAAVLGGERFLAEVKVTARLHHPHILTLIDSGEADGQLYYVLPYVRGDSLRARLDHEKQLGIGEALRITRQIASALDYAHQQGVVHRDIKPENILFHEGEAMLADFGIALAVKQAGGNRLTETGLSLGTPQYMSPEQATGDRQLDARSDVYSLGAVLYEMLAGEPPVTGPTVQAVIAKLLTEKPTRLRVVRDTIPEGIDSAVVKALAKVPSDRFASAGELSAALDRAVEPVRVGPEKRLPAWLLPVGVVAVIGAAVFALTRPRGGAPAPAVTPVRTQATFTGNAEGASISPDGSRIAFAARRCEAPGRCAYDVVVQDVGGAGSLTVMRGAVSVWGTGWSPDGRYLMVGGSKGVNWGSFVVPATVQGTERFLGSAFASFLNGSDSLLVGGIWAPGDTLQTLRVLTLGDGAARDSFSIRRTTIEGSPAVPSPDGRWVTYGEAAGDSSRVLLVNRSGKAVDSFLVPDARDVKWTPDGSGLLLAVRASAGGLSDIVLQSIDRKTGRRIGGLQPVVRDIDLGEERSFDITRDGGTLRYSMGPLLRSVVALSRSDPTSVRFTARTLKSSTADLMGSVSPRGDRIAMRTLIAAGERRRYQFSLMPFDSGPSVIVVPEAEQILDFVWYEAPGSDMVYAQKEGTRIRYTSFDAATGRSRQLFTLPDSLGGDGFIKLPDGRFVTQDVAGRKFRVVSTTGQLERELDVPVDLFAPGLLRSSAVHHDIVLVGWDRRQDSLLVLRLNPADGSSARVGVVQGEGWRGAKQLNDGSVQLVIEEAGGTSGLYLFPAQGGAARRLGSLPFNTANYIFSSDGRHLVATVRESKADVWLIKNLKELLPR